jgi:hypothetical protein
MPACLPANWCIAGLEAFSGKLAITPAEVIVKSAVQIKFTLKFNASLPAAAGAVKLFISSAVGSPLQDLADMQPAGTDDSTYAASLALQGPQLGSLSSRPGVLRFTAVLGARNTTTGALAQLELLPGVCLSTDTAVAAVDARDVFSTVCHYSKQCNCCGNQCV